MTVNKHHVAVVATSLLAIACDTKSKMGEAVLTTPLDVNAWSMSQWICLSAWRERMERIWKRLFHGKEMSRTQINADHIQLKFEDMKDNRIRPILIMACLLFVGIATRAQNGLNRSAMEVINDMAPGWNLGNTFEATTSWTGGALWNNKGGLGTETGWQDTKTSQEIIDFVKSLGFKSVRIPCAWAFGHISNASTYEIDGQWMARVKEVVDYCINDGLYVVLNDHWDGGWLENHIKDSDAGTIEKNKEILTALWTQIANAFIDYDEHLLFAGLNEPNAEDQAATNNLIQYNQTFVDAVRATGGNNAKRILVVQGPSTNIYHTCNFMTGKMPTDVTEGKLAVEIHYYNPWQFWGMEKDESWGKVFYYWGKGNHYSGSTHNATWGEEDDMKNQLQMMKSNFVDKGYPVVIGEFGA